MYGSDRVARWVCEPGRDRVAGNIGEGESAMAEFSFEPLYPDLFEGLSERDKWVVEQSLANGRLEGWHPTREEVATATAFQRGELTADQVIDQTIHRVTGSARTAV